MSMGRIAAQNLARAETLSFGQLRVIIENARNRGGGSRVNRAFPLSRACEIYSAAIADRPEDEIPKAWRSDPYSPSGKMVPTRDFLIVCNILRDCGP